MLTFLLKYLDVRVCMDLFGTARFAAALRFLRSDRLEVMYYHPRFGGSAVRHAYVFFFLLKNKTKRLVQI